MYAATYGEDESVITLLRAGADLYKRDNSNGSDFLDYAFRRENWNVLDRTLQDSKLLYSPSRSQSIVDYVTVRLLMVFHPIDCSTHLRRLLSLGADPNVTCPDGSTLLHHVRKPDETEALFEAGFRRINDPDEGGVHPLMKLVQLPYPNLVQKCLERGASVSDQNDHGWTVLHYAVLELRFKVLSTSCDQLCHDAARRAGVVVTVIRLLLKHGADPRARDSCLCACSQAGCTPCSVLLANSGLFFYDDHKTFWTLEWLQVISETVPERDCREICREVFIEMVRAMRFSLTELVHVCCHQRKHWNREADDDIDNILDEQSIEIQELGDSLEILATGESPDYTETWIQELAQHVTEYKAPVSGVQDFVVDYEYIVGTKRDEFRWKQVETGPKRTTPDMTRRVDIQAYLDWVAYCYDQRAEFSQCAGIDEDWRKRRIRSALRLRQVLEERRLEGGNEVEEC
jgi:ankyrin repeat protein